MVKLLYLTPHLKDVVAADEIKGHPNHYDIERGVSKDLMVFFGQVVHDGACCDHLGDCLELNMDQLANISDHWHLAYPEACHFKLGEQHKFYQLYLMPHNNPLFKHGLEKFGGDEVDALGNLGLEYICSVTADALPQAMESQLLPLDPATQHLHAVICVETLPLMLRKETANSAADVTAKSCGETAAGAHGTEGITHKVMENAAMHQVV